MKKIVLSAGLIVCLQASEASEKALRNFFADVDTMQAEFTQKIEDERGAVLERTEGVLYLSRPGKFRWDYKNSEDAEYPGQQIVADGKHLYFYDPDLEQVSQRSLENALGQVPSLLLVQSGADLDKHFSVTEYGRTDGLSWVSLKPKEADASYQQLMIGFDGDTLRSIMLYDGLGNSTRLELRKLESNLKFQTEVFTFEIPESADLLTE